MIHIRQKDYDSLERSPELTKPKPVETADAAASTDTYALRFAGDWGAWLLSVQTAIILAMLPEKSESSVLDVGGGHAQIAPVMREEGHDVRVMVSEEASTERLLRSGIPVEDISVGSLMDLPFADRSFDAVVSLRMMAHVKDPAGYVAELCRVADKAVILDYTSNQGVGRIGTWFYLPKRLIEGDTRRYKISGRAEIAELLERNGFVIDEHQGQFALPVVVHRKLKNPKISSAIERVLASQARRYGNPVLLRARRVTAAA